MQIRYKYILGILLLILFFVWFSVFSTDTDLHLVACDVGQGDAILATYGNIQILTDGGANNRILDCLGRHMPFWDRTIELVILTHPDRDHFKGLIEVFRRYKIDNYLDNGLESGSQEYQVLKNEVGGGGIKTMVAGEGLLLRVGEIRLEILNPTPQQRGVLSTKVTEKNEYSIVNTLSLGSFDALLTGDVENAVLDRIAEQLALSAKREWEYIKIPHHGSKNGLTQKLLDMVKPDIAVISVGKNSYGHPHEEALKILRDSDTKILRTDEMGDVEVITNGKKFWVKN